MARIDARGRIVVGVDGSDGSRHALAWALDEASRRGATLEVAHVWSTPVAMAHMGAVVIPEDRTAFERNAHAWMGPIVEEVRPAAEQAGVALELLVTEGHATTTLLDRLREADLLVVGRRGHTGIAGLLVGSVSDQLVHHAHGPVAIVPPEAAVPADGDVVVGVDGSEHSYEAVRWAVDEAGRRGSRLSVLHAWASSAAAVPVGIAITDDDAADFRADADRRLHDLVDGIVANAEVPPPAVDLVAVEERAAEALVDRSHGAALVIVGSRGKGGFSELLLGSVSRRVVHHAASAVVVIR